MKNLIKTTFNYHDDKDVKVEWVKEAAKVAAKSKENEFGLE